MVAIDTRKVGERRRLRFESVEAVQREVEQIVDAHRNGNLRQLGNWSAGQILSHLSAWIEYGYEGYPMGKPPWFVRWILRSMLRRILRKGMPSGVRIPGTSEGTFGQDLAEVEAAAHRLQIALNRLNNGEACSFDSPAFGPMSHADRIKLNLRHAELHLSFLLH